MCGALCHKGGSTNGVSTHYRGCDQRLACAKLSGTIFAAELALGLGPGGGGNGILRFNRGAVQWMVGYGAVEARIVRSGRLQCSSWRAAPCVVHW